MDAPWMLAASTALVLAAQGLRAGRRRSALNEALHELRRPLQALVLAAPGVGLGPGATEWSLQMASAALARLDREINGDGASPPAVSIAVDVEPLLHAAAERWTARAALAGGTFQLRWMAAGASVHGDRCELAQALDNLVANAIEHGGSAIALEAKCGSGWLTLAVVDSGPARRRSAPARATRLVSRLRGSSRHGHGLAVVRRVAAAHGGRFELRRSSARTVAAIELPLLSPRAEVGR
jgi:two-component system OmpR family sensor kinase